MQCVIEGWPDGGGIDAELHLALTALVRRETEGWDRPPRVIAHPSCFRIEASAADWPALARCVVLAMRMGATRAKWLWHITDDARCIAAELSVSDLVAWRGLFCLLNGAPSGWSPALISVDKSRDIEIRRRLSVVAAGSMKAMGVRGAVTAPAPAEAALRLFEHVPAEGWKRTAQPAAIGRSMIQIDERSGDRHRIKGRVEVCNTGSRALDVVRVQVNLRGPHGALIGMISADSADLPPGSIRVVTLSGEQPLGRLSVLTIDLGCQAIQQASASFSAHVLEA